MPSRLVSSAARFPRLWAQAVRAVCVWGAAPSLNQNLIAGRLPSRSMSSVSLAWLASPAGLSTDHHCLPSHPGQRHTIPPIEVTVYGVRIPLDRISIQYRGGFVLGAWREEGSAYARFIAVTIGSRLVASVETSKHTVYVGKFHGRFSTRATARRNLQNCRPRDRLSGGSSGLSLTRRSSDVMFASGSVGPVISGL